jgi:glycosyltransferase involved in cell wall biosynthesis
MKIAFVVNLDTSSAIARETLKLCHYLRFELGHEVVIFSIAEYEKIESVMAVQTFSHPKEIISRLQEFEHVVYPIGDSPHHSSSVYLISKVPGFCIMHDTDVRHLLHSFVNTYHENSLSKVYENYKESLGSIENQLETNMDLIRLSTSLSWKNLPHAEILLLGSYGWMTHSEFAMKKLNSLSMSKGSMCNLPFTSQSDFEDMLQSNQSEAIDSFVVIGMINANKSPERIIRSFRLVLDQRPNALLKFVGFIDTDMKIKLSNTVSKLGLEESIDFVGQVSSARLYRELTDAKVFLNLRNPVLEAASYSVLEQLYTGRPVIAFNQGHFMEMPDSAIIKVPVDISDKELSRTMLDALVASNAITSEEIHTKRSFVVNNHDMGIYARHLIHSLQSLDASKVVQSGLVDVATNLSNNLNNSRELTDLISKDLEWIVQSIANG